MAFKNLVVNTMLSGMEAEVLRECDYEKMEKVVMNLARKVVGQRGVYPHEDGKRQHTNQYVRSLLRITNLKDLLRIRRLKWLQAIAEEEEQLHREPPWLQAKATGVLPS